MLSLMLCAFEHVNERLQAQYRVSGKSRLNNLLLCLSTRVSKRGSKSSLHTIFPNDPMVCLEYGERSQQNDITFPPTANIAHNINDSTHNIVKDLIIKACIIYFGATGAFQLRLNPTSIDFAMEE
jgi:hypothetical protein